MTSVTTPIALGSLRQTSKGATRLFSSLGIYHFCIAFFVIDSLDLMDFLDFGIIKDVVKYGYAAIVIAFIIIYFLRWRKVDASVAQTIFLSFFVITGIAFAINFFTNDERQSYISAFISPLVFSLAMFIPPNTVMVDARRMTRMLTFLFAAGSVLYLIEAIIKPLHAVHDLTSLHEVQIHKSLTCVLALCLCILTGRKALGLLVAAVTTFALILRPLSTLVLALSCCLPIAVALRFRVLRWGLASVSIARGLAMATLLVAISVPLLLYFFWNDAAPIIESLETSLKSDVIGGHSNMEFRLTILQIAFAGIDSTSFWYGSALSGTHTVLLGLMPGWEWWLHNLGNEEATIHSDFVAIFVLMGIIGYTVFSVALYLVLATRFRELKRRDLRGASVVLQAISIIGLVALVVYISDQPYLSYYNHTNSVWMLLLISEVARKSKAVDYKGSVRP